MTEPRLEMIATRSGMCLCGERIEKGDPLAKAGDDWLHADCADDAETLRTGARERRQAQAAARDAAGSVD